MTLHGTKCHNPIYAAVSAKPDFETNPGMMFFLITWTAWDDDDDSTVFLMSWTGLNRRYV